MKTYLIYGGVLVAGMALGAGLYHLMQKKPAGSTAGTGSNTSSAATTGSNANTVGSTTVTTQKTDSI